MKKRVLLIEDTSEMQSILKSFLSKEYDVQIAANGLDAMLELHKGNLPDVIITDLQMPEMNGRDFLEQLKLSGSFSHIPVIVLSNNQESEQRIDLLQMGAEDYITKPFNPQELLVRLNKVIRNFPQSY